MSYNNIFYLQIIDPVILDVNLGELLSDEASQLALYSAIATVVSPEDLEKQIIDKTPAIIQLINSVLLIGERYDFFWYLRLTKRLFLAVLCYLEAFTGFKLNGRIVCL